MTRIADSWLPEFDHETAMTRVLLERLPAEALDWRPHEKSFTLGGLATHLTQLPHWGTTILDRETYDLAGTGSGRPRPSFTTVDVLLDAFDRTVDELRRAVTGRTDAELVAPWTLMRGGQALVTMPRIAALRRFVLHHLVHHRGQLTVYLRLCDVPLPPLYGPSADERP